MSQVVLLIRCKGPSSYWYKIYASGDEVPEMYEEVLKFNMNRYSVVGYTVKERRYCDNSLLEHDEIMRRLYANVEIKHKDHGWFGGANIAKIRKIVRGKP